MSTVPIFFESGVYHVFDINFKYVGVVYCIGDNEKITECANNLMSARGYRSQRPMLISDKNLQAQISERGQDAVFSSPFGEEDMSSTQLRSSARPKTFKPRQDTAGKPQPRKLRTDQSRTAVRH